MKVDLQLLGEIQRDLALATKMVRGVTLSYHATGDFNIAKQAAARAAYKIDAVLEADTEDPDFVETPPDTHPWPSLEEQATGAQLKRGLAIADDFIQAGGDVKKSKRAAAKPKATVSTPGLQTHPPPAAGAQQLGTTTRDLITQVLRAKKGGGMNSNEVHQEVCKHRKGTPIQSIYAELSVMRKAGLVASREDEADGQRKNYLP